MLVGRCFVEEKAKRRLQGVSVSMGVTVRVNVGVSVRLSFRVRVRGRDCDAVRELYSHVDGWRCD